MALGGAFLVAAIAVADTAGWVRTGERRGGYRPVVSGRPREVPPGPSPIPRKDMRAIDAKAAEQRVSIMHMHTKQLTTLVSEAKATPIPERAVCAWCEHQTGSDEFAKCGVSQRNRTYCSSVNPSARCGLFTISKRTAKARMSGERMPLPRPGAES